MGRRKDYVAALKNEILRIIHRKAKVAKGLVETQWSQYTDKSLGNAKFKVAPALAKEDAKGMLEQLLIIEGQKAWLLEYGRGSLMVNTFAENPYLEEYVSSPLFNKWRTFNAFAITGRTKGEKYYDLDGNGSGVDENGKVRPFISTGTLMGVNLEQWYSSKGTHLYTPISPKRIIHNVLESEDILGEMQEEIMDATSRIYAESIDRFLEMKVSFKL